MKVPPPSLLEWHDYAADKPDPINGYFLLIRRPVVGDGPGQFPVEAQRWAGCPGEPNEWYQSDGEDTIPDDDILFWANLPEVMLPNAKMTGPPDEPQLTHGADSGSASINLLDLF
jgi:hypothetical protein